MRAAARRTLLRASTCESLHCFFADSLTGQTSLKVAGRPADVLASGICHPRPTAPAWPRAADRLHPLLPPGPPATAQEIAESFGLHLPRAEATVTAPARPRVLLNMVSTIDGRATLGGRSGPIGGRADREMFHALRTVVDAVLVGAGTARAEHYGRLVREESLRALRRERGLRTNRWPASSPDAWR